MTTKTNMDELIDTLLKVEDQFHLELIRQTARAIRTTGSAMFDKIDPPKRYRATVMAYVIASQAVAMSGEIVARKQMNDDSKAVERDSEDKLLEVLLLTSQGIISAAKRLIPEMTEPVAAVIYKMPLKPKR